MRDYQIITDSTCDLPDNYYSQNDVEVLSLRFIIDENEYTSLEKMKMEEFYALLRNHKIAKTSQVPLGDFENMFVKYLEKGIDVIYFAFSSALSGTFSSASGVAAELSMRYPERRIYVVDTKCASLGEGLFLMKLVDKADSGASIDELYQWALDTRLKIVHLFTVDDLMFLHRGGRVSKTAAVAGSILGIKPVLHVDDEGRLIPVKKVRGRKQSLIELVNMMETQIGDVPNPYIAISHGDCAEEAKFVAAEVKKRFGIKKCTINFVGPVIGSHSGPGTIALFFEGITR